MAHWAEISISGTVVRVTVGNNDDPDEGYGWLVDNLGGTWVKTSYNTYGGIHYDPATGEPSADQSKALRYNYAGIGFTFSEAPAWAAQGGAFIPPRPFPSWTLNPDTALWDAPTPMPAEGGPWVWVEESLSWVEVTPEA